MRNMSTKIKDNYKYMIYFELFEYLVILTLILVDNFIIYFQNILFYFNLLFKLKNKKFPCATAAQGVIRGAGSLTRGVRYRGYTQCPSVLG